MIYNRLGRSGLKVSALSFGSWLTFGSGLDLDAVKACMRLAFDSGVNLFDNAEAYADGEAEVLMGKALSDYRREDLVITTKIFWGGKGPNDTGLSAKHLLEGTAASLRRLGVDCVDLLFCHRPDPDVPMEEVVRTMDLLVRQGKAIYWGTSEWSAVEIMEAHLVAAQLHAVPPVVEQPQYNLFVRARVEREYLPLYRRFGMGTTTWSPLASGILTGKYAQGVPKGSRLDRVSWLRNRLDAAKLEKVRALEPIARGVGASLAQLAIAWCLKCPHVSSVILGATSPRQLEENLGALDLAARLGPAQLEAIEAVCPP
jgi:voltage-dependent potassium channel beta subunit